MDFTKDELQIDDGHESQRGRNLELLRVPAGGRIGGICCDKTPAMVFTHYWGGRTVPCLKLCEPCNSHSRRDWHGYLMLYQASTAKTAVVELTEACRDTVLQFLKNNESARGARVSLKRKGEARNGRLSLEICRGVPSTDLPESIDLLSWLCHLWGGGGRQGEAVASTARAHQAFHSRFSSNGTGRREND